MLTEQFMHGLDNKVMIGEVIRGLTTINDASETPREQILI